MQKESKHFYPTAWVSKKKVHDNWGVEEYAFKTTRLNWSLWHVHSQLICDPTNYGLEIFYLCHNVRHGNTWTLPGSHLGLDCHSDVFREVEKGCIGNKWVKSFLLPEFLSVFIWNIIEKALILSILFCFAFFTFSYQIEILRISWRHF